MLAFAAASGRIGSVFLQGDKLLDWQISKKASKNGFEAASYARSPVSYTHLTLPTKA